MEDYQPDDDASNAIDDDAPAPLLTPKQRAGASTKAPLLSEEQKRKLAEQWAPYVEYMDHQRTQGWKT